MDVARAHVLAAVLIFAAAAPAGADALRPVQQPAVLSQCSSRIGKLEFQPPALAAERFSTFSAMISVTCTATTSFRLTLLSANGCRLRSGRQTVSYVLSLDVAGTRPLLDCGPMKLEYAGKGSEAFMIYGRTSAIRTFSGDTAYSAGTYTDDISVEVETHR